jgi:hypothetical protein
MKKGGIGRTLSTQGELIDPVNGSIKGLERLGADEMIMLKLMLEVDENM